MTSDLPKCVHFAIFAAWACLPVSIPGRRVVLNILSICVEHIGTVPSARNWPGEEKLDQHQGLGEEKPSGFQGGWYSPVHVRHVPACVGTAALRAPCFRPSQPAGVLGLYTGGPSHRDIQHTDRVKHCLFHKENSDTLFYDYFITGK